MPRIDLKHFSVIFFILTLWGCANKPAPLQLPEGWALQRDQLEAYTTWQIKGKLAYKRNDEAFSANMRWQHGDSLSSLRLFNTLGITMVDMTVTPDEAILEVDGDEYRDSNAEVLLYNTTGWDIPVAKLRRWIKGLPEANDKLAFNPNGTLKTLYPSCLRCRKWMVEYNRFTQVDGLVLPSAITVRDLTQDNAFIKLRISSWR